MPAKSLQIAHGFHLPLEAVTQSIGILAKRRAGKSYTARRFAEQFLHAGEQVVIIDPKGDWWGIRSAADGKGPGFPVVIIGGEHADVPLEVGAGEVIAKLVVEERVSILLDVSSLRKREVAQFMGGDTWRQGFLEALYRLKAKEQFRSPMMLVVDEADAIAPQKPYQGEERMLGAMEDIVRRGGQRGIGCLPITQRSAVLNKNVLTQVQMLIALRTIAPQDLAAMNAWIDVHGTVEQRKILMESLPSLPVGDAWFWSPGWPTEDGIFKRVHVMPIETFDSGATPKPGEKRIEPKNVANVDLDALRRQMADTIERAKADDPKELKKQIADLKRQALSQPAQPVTKEIPAERLKAEFEKGVQAERKRIASDVHAPLRKVHASLRNFLPLAVSIKRTDAEIAVCRQNFGDVEMAALAPILDALSRSAPVPESQVFRPLPPQAARAAPAPRRAPQPSPVDGDVKLASGARRMLAVLAKWYPAAISEGQLRAEAGLRKGGTYDTYKSRLSTAGYIARDGAGRFACTEAGRDAIGSDALEVPQTTADVLAIWRPKLGGGAQRILDALIQNGGSMDKPELQEASSLSEGGTFDTYISRLRTANLIVSPERGYFAANRETLLLA